MKISQALLLTFLVDNPRINNFLRHTFTIICIRSQDSIRIYIVYLTLCRTFCWGRNKTNGELNFACLGRLFCLILLIKKEFFNSIWNQVPFKNFLPGMHRKFYFSKFSPSWELKYTAQCQKSNILCIIEIKRVWSGSNNVYIFIYWLVVYNVFLILA